MEDASSPSYRGFRAKWKGRDFRSSPDSASKLKAAKDAWRQSYGSTEAGSPEQEQLLEMRRVAGSPSSVEEFKERREEALAADVPVEEDPPAPPEADEDACFTSPPPDHFTHRLLMLWQCLLIVLIIVGWVWYITNYQMFSASSHQLAPPDEKATSVVEFANAFEVPKGSKKGTPPGDPDIVYFLTPQVDKWFGDQRGTWVWSHGELYLLLPTAMLHAVSGGMMDPTYFTTQPAVDEHKMPECFRQDGSKLECIKSFIGPYLNDKHPPKGGYFAFVTEYEMFIFHYETKFGISFVPTEKALIWTFTLMMMGSITCTALLGACVMTAGMIYTAGHSHKEYLKEYIAKGMFMHNDEHHEFYDQIHEPYPLQVLEEIHDEHHAEEAEQDPDDIEEGHEEMHDDHPGVEAAKKKIEKKLRLKIHGTQSILHLVSHHATGGKPKKQTGSNELNNSGPSLISQMITRATETFSHAFLMIITCSPVLVCNALFKAGIDKFGSFALNSGVCPPGTVVHYFHMAMLGASIMSWILLVSLILHYIAHEFGDVEHSGVFARMLKNPFLRVMFHSWEGFSYIQMAMFWLSAIMVNMFLLMGAMGLVLHAFTNMFMVTSVIGVAATGYYQFLFFSGILHEVMGEIHHAQVIMDDLVDALGKRLMALRLKKVDKLECPEKAKKAKKKQKNMQKAILMVQSGFANCVTHQLHEAGFSPKDFAIQLGGAFLAAGIVISIVYSGMKAAHLFGKAVQAAGSALAGGAFAVMNASKDKPKGKGPPKFPPKIQLAIDGLNEGLQLTVEDSVMDLVYMLRHDSHCVDIVTGAIAQAEKEMAEEDEDPWAKKNAQIFIKHAKDGLKKGKKKVKKHLKEKAAKEAALLGN